MNRHHWLVDKAVKITGRPNRKNSKGAGALQELANQLEVDHRSLYRWIAKDRVPDWAVERIEEIWREKQNA